MHSHGHVPAGVRWLLCGGIAAYFGFAVLGAIIMRTPRGGAVALAALLVLLPVLLGLLGAQLAAPALTWLMTAIVGAQVALAVWDDRRRARDLKIG